VSVSNGLVDPGDILADGLVIPTRHADHVVNTDVVEPLEVLLAVHLDFQLYPDELVHSPRLLEVLAGWGGSMSTVEEFPCKLGVEGGQAAGEGGTESGDTGDGCSQWWDGQEVVDEWNGASLGDALHPINAIHGSGFVKCTHDGLEQLRVEDRGAEVRNQFLVEDLSDPYREFGLQGAEIERCVECGD